MRIASILLLVLSGVVCAVMPARAAKSFDACSHPISSLPYLVNSPGTFCLKQDLIYSGTSGAAITIAQLSNVTLDCNDFTVNGLGAGAATKAAGIYTQQGSGVTIRNCNVRGFYRGIDLETPTPQAGVSGHLVEDNHLDSNTIVGIKVTGDNAIIRRNVVVDTGGSTVTPSNASGITTSGMVEVYDNTVSGVVTSTGTGEIAKGIYIGATSFASVHGNHISGVVGSQTTGNAYGIDLASVTRAAVRDNTVTNNAGFNVQGIFCSTTGDRLRNNVVAHSSLGGCGDAGGNDFGP